MSVPIVLLVHFGQHVKFTILQGRVFMSSRIGYHHIPPCKGLHSQYAEQHCLDCLDMAHRDEVLRLKRREIELLEIIADAGPREPRRTFVPPSITDHAPITRRGL